LDFATTGTRFFLGGVLVVTDPWPLSRALNQLREEVFRGAFINPKFHASTDLQATRDRVFDCMTSCGTFEHHAFVIEKNSIPTSHQEESVFYTTIADFALRQTLLLYPTADPIYVITDRLPVNRKRDAVKKGFQNCMAAVCGSRRYEIGHHASEAHPCLQAADYVNWAVFRKWERADNRSFQLIKNFISQEVKFDGRILRP
jgi:hypothetical protein